MSYARVALLRFKPETDFDDIRSKAEQVVTHLRQQPGFLSYTAMRAGDDIAIVLTVWATREQGEQGVTAAEQWNRQNLGALVASVQGYFGEVILQQQAVE
jgi:heme-degrading monooxygenase HmoA